MKQEGEDKCSISINRLIQLVPKMNEGIMEIGIERIIFGEV